MKSTKPTVLFVDDDALTRKVYTAGLAMAGILTHVVGSPEEALKVLENQQVDVIITDLMMPRFTGVDVIKAVRECDYTKHLPILLFTSGADSELAGQAEKAGATEILQKQNTTPAKLIEHILKLHEKKK